MSFYCLYLAASSDLDTFMQTSDHFKSKTLIIKCPDNLFTVKTRPSYVTAAYEEAALTPVHVFRSLDTYRRDGRIGSDYFFCQPVFTDPLIKKLKRIKNLDIELEKVSELDECLSSSSSFNMFFFFSSSFWLFCLFFFSSFLCES